MKKMKLKKIKGLNNEIQNLIFNESKAINHYLFCEKCIKIANLISNFDGDNQDWFYLNVEDGIDLCDLIVALYWYYREKNRTDSKSNEALIALAKIFSSGNEQGPDTSENSPELRCYQALNSLS
jgi:hypothetical protein